MNRGVSTVKTTSLREKKKQTIEKQSEIRVVKNSVLEGRLTAQPAAGDKQAKAGTWEWGPKEVSLFFKVIWRQLHTKPKLKTGIQLKIKSFWDLVTLVQYSALLEGTSLSLGLLSWKLLTPGLVTVAILIFWDAAEDTGKSATSISG